MTVQNFRVLQRDAALLPGVLFATGCEMEKIDFDDDEVEMERGVGLKIAGLLSQDEMPSHWLIAYAKS